MKMLVTYDGSPASKAVLEPAAELARAASAEIVLLRVLRPPLDIVAHPDEQVRESRLKRMETDWKAELGEIGRSLGGSVLTDVRRLGQRWNVVDEILAAAEDHDVDIICMASHSESAVRHFVVGSTALDVLSKSECPVLLVKSL